MEHFTDEQIIQMLNEQMRVADSIVFSVPSIYFDENMKDGHPFGDERYMPNKKWREIISYTNGELITQAGDNQRSLKHRIGHIIKDPRKLLKPKAFSVFEIKERK
jgi:hypothetical protein